MGPASSPHTSAPELSAAISKPPFAAAANRRWLAFTMVVSSFIYGVDLTIINLALPSIEKIFLATHDQVQWIMTANIVAFATAMPCIGWLSSRFGRRRVFCISLFAFSVATLSCAFARSVPALIALRALQGALGAPLYPLSLSILLDAYEKNEHTRVVAWWNAGSFLGPFLGPSLGGFLLHYFEWNSVFLAMLPPCAFALVLALRFVPEAATASPRKLDVGGFLSISIAVASIQLCLGRIGGQTSSVAESVTESAVFLLSLAYFIVHTSRTEHGLFEPGLLKDRNFFAAMLMTFMLFFTSYATVILTPLLLTDIHSADNLVIGMLMLPRAIGNVSGVASAAALSKLMGPRPIMALGVALMTAAVLEFALLDADVSSWQVATAGLVQGLGLGIASVPLNVQAFATLAVAARNDASALRMIFRTIGGSLGIAAVISVVTVARQRGASDWQVLIPLLAALGDTGDPILGSYRLAFLLLMGVTVAAMCMIMLFGTAPKAAVDKA